MAKKKVTGGEPEDVEISVLYVQLKNGKIDLDENVFDTQEEFVEFIKANPGEDPNFVVLEKGVVVAD